MLKFVVSGVLGRSSSPRLARRSIILIDYLKFGGPNTPRIIVVRAIPAIHNSRTTTNSKPPTPNPVAFSQSLISHLIASCTEMTPRVRVPC